MERVLSETQINGFEYFQEKLLEKPFFLGVNGISGEPIEGKPWSLSFNPVLCEVYDNASFEDLVIFLFHIHHYINDKKDTIEKHFDQFQRVFLKIVEKVSTEFYPENELKKDEVITAYNLLVQIEHFSLKLSKSLSTQTYSEIIELNYIKVADLLRRLRDVEDFPSKPELTKLIVAGLDKVMYSFYLIHSVTKHNDLKDGNTQIVMWADEATFSSKLMVENVRDAFFLQPRARVIITDETVTVETFDIYAQSRFSHLDKVISEPEDSMNYRVDDTTIISKKNMVNYEKLNTTNPNFTESLDEFDGTFWKARYKRDEKNECILFSPEETKFIFQFITRYAKSFTTVTEKKNLDEKLFKGNVLTFYKILNSLRFLEIDQAISLRTVVLFMKNVLKMLYFPKDFIEGTCGGLYLVVTRITEFLACKEQIKCVQHVINRVLSRVVILRDPVPLESLARIPKLRRSRWGNLLGEQATAEKFLQIHNEGECPVCLQEMQEEDYNLLICKHNICKSCLKILIGIHDISNLCPVCRSPLREYLPSDQIEEICSALQQLSTDDN